MNSLSDRILATWLDWQARFRKEDGLEMIEWLGMVAVFLALTAVLIEVMSGRGGTRIGNAMVTVLVKWIKSLAA